jgi:hypothetical protein
MAKGERYKEPVLVSGVNEIAPTIEPEEIMEVFAGLPYVSRQARA